LRDKNTTYQKGFTLIELMVAVMVFAIIATASYSALNTVLFQKERTNKVSQILMQLQNTHRIISHDLSLVAPRSINNEFDNLRSPFEGKKEDSILMEFSKAGVLNPLLQAKSSIQRVAYLLEDDKLYRISYDKIDRTSSTTQRRRLLLEGLADVEIEFLLDKNGKSKVTNFPHYSKQTMFPLGVRLKFEIDNFDKIEWLWDI
jgi:general secretion pathway protein J